REKDRRPSRYRSSAFYLYLDPSRASSHVLRHAKKSPVTGAFRSSSWSEARLVRRAQVLLHAGVDFLARGIEALPAVDLHPLALFQVLVMGEEVRDALQHQRVHVLD